MTRTMSLAGTTLVVERGECRPLLFLHPGEGLRPSVLGSVCWQPGTASSRPCTRATAAPRQFGGVPVTDFAHQLECNDLVKEARAIISDLVSPVRSEVRIRKGRLIRSSHWEAYGKRPLVRAHPRQSSCDSVQLGGQA
jgi:hypothetical protein